MDYALAVILDLTQPDKPFPRKKLTAIGHLELLEIRVEAGRIFFRQQIIFYPLLEVRRSTRVNVIRVAVGLEPLAEDDSDKIMRAERQVARLHLRTDFVVR